MVQTTFPLVDAGATSGNQMVDYHYNKLAALRSLESGSTPPVNPPVGGLWQDDSNSQLPHIKVWSGSTWVTLFVLDKANSRIRQVLDNDLDSYIAPTGTDEQMGVWIGGALSFIFSNTGMTFGTSDSGLALDVSGKNSAIGLPVGTTSQRPTASAGRIRQNSSTGRPEVGDGTVFKPLAYQEEAGAGYTFLSGSSPLTGIPAGTSHIKLVAANVPILNYAGYSFGSLGIQLGDSGGLEGNWVSISGAPSLWRASTNGSAWVLEQGAATSSMSVSGVLDRIAVGRRYSTTGGQSGWWTANATASILYQ